MIVHCIWYKQAGKKEWQWAITELERVYLYIILTNITNYKTNYKLKKKCAFIKKNNFDVLVKSVSIS